MPDSIKAGNVQFSFLPDCSVSEWRRQTNRRSTVCFHRGVSETRTEFTSVPYVKLEPGDFVFTATFGAIDLAVPNSDRTAYIMLPPRLGRRAHWSAEYLAWIKRMR